MAGAICPKCGNQTLYREKSDALKRRCTKCGCQTIEQSANNGRGFKCPICKRFTLKNDRCESCGTRVIGGKR